MKKVILTIAALVVSSTSHAVVADKFKCTLEVKDLESKASTKEEKDFFIARLPLSGSPAPHVRITAGETIEDLALSTPKGEISANLYLYYKHAVRTDVNGNPLEARQFTCIALTGSYCESSSGDGSGHNQSCSIGAFACAEPPNPFDPDTGWSPTALFSGVPTFNEQTLGPSTTNISDDSGNTIGVASFSCRYLGSFR
jgi:hypothetical protein